MNEALAHSGKSSALTRGCEGTALKSLAAMSPPSRRSRFFENVE